GLRGTTRLWRVPNHHQPTTGDVDVLITLLDDVPLPTYAHPGDAGADLVTTVDVELAPGERAVVPTGVSIALPDGYAAFVHPRARASCCAAATGSRSSSCSRSSGRGSCRPSGCPARTAGRAGSGRAAGGRPRPDRRSRPAAARASVESVRGERPVRSPGRAPGR